MVKKKYMFCVKMIKTKKNKINHKRKTKKVLKGGDPQKNEILKRLEKSGAVKLSTTPTERYLRQKGISTKKNSLSSSRSRSRKSASNKNPPQYIPPDYNNNTPQLSKEIINFIKNYNTKQYYVDLLKQINDRNLDYYIDFYKNTYELLQLVKDNNKEYVINLINNIE